MQPKTVEGAVEAYLKEFKDAGITVEEVNSLVRDDGWTFENVRIMLFHRSTSFLLTVFAFEAADFVRDYPALFVQRPKFSFGRFRRYSIAFVLT